MAQKQLIILYTDILIEIIRMNATVIQKCDRLGAQNLAISSISYCEFLAGSYDKAELLRNINFLDKFILVSVNNKIDKLLTALFKSFAISHRPGIPDMLIAATSLYYNHSVYTNNKKHFQFIPHIKLV